MGTPVNIIVGSHVWIEDPEEAWMDGEVTEIKGRDATIITINGKTVFADISSIYPKDTEAPPAGVDDMTKLAYLHEPGVLYNLACRFALNEIYVISRMRTLMAEDSIKMPNNTFLLDVDSSIPFSMEEISGSLSAIHLSNMDPPPLPRQRSDFHFLLQEKQTETH